MDIKLFFDQNPETAIAFSGGVDSAYLLYAAKRYARRVKAYYVKTAFQPQFELEDALRLAKELDADMEVISLNVLDNAAVAANPKNRCYHCKHTIFSNILAHAVDDGFSVLLDGTNASDDADDRPGMVALRELCVLSPLRLCGLTKPEIRALSREAGLFTWNKPAYACLATRIPTGTTITEALLSRTERAETALHDMGFSDFRVRMMGDAARLEVTEAQLPLVLSRRKEITDLLLKEYGSVLLNLEVRT